MTQEEYRQAERYFEIWTDLILSGVDKYEANVKAQEILEQEDYDKEQENLW
ncbi:MAG: hypothetical protein VW518_10150 [Burkholderiaceae bacterium]